MAGHRAGRVEHLDQALERQVLVGIGGEVGAAHALEQLAEARIAGGVGAQHQGVDEEADEIVEGIVGATGDRAAERDVGAGAEPGEQGGQRRLQHHEQARLCLAGERQQLLVQVGIEPEGDAVAAIAGDGGPRPVGRQVELLGQAGQCLLPVGELLADEAARDRSPRRAARAARACSRHTGPAAASRPARRPGSARA